jgi:GT2 family glycosyltransferase
MHVDSPHDRVLLVNDAGPEVDAIESVAREVTAGLDRFRYERNERNLGFVGACNRAALELDTSDRDILLLNSDTETTPGFLDELSAVLHESPDHGVVCPRSNNATIASLPHRLRDPTSPRTAERTRAVHEALAGELPRFSYAPVSMGFCFLVRRELITAHGLFDEAFSPGYGEENDFCLRMGALGHRSLIAHRALVFHLGSRSFSRARRAKLRAAHERLLVERHPHFPAAVRDYLTRGADPVDVFADVLAPADDRPRILLDLGRRADAATRDHQELLVRAAHRATQSEDAEVTIVGGTQALRAEFAPGPLLRWVPAAEGQGLFDLGVTWWPSTSLDRAAAMNLDCARWAVLGRAPVGDETRRFADDLPLGSDDGANRDLLLEIARRPVDLDRLRERWRFYERVTARLGAPAPARRAAFHWLDRHAPRIAGVARKVRRWSRRG